jgi:hypothetical protein
MPDLSALFITVLRTSHWTCAHFLGVFWYNATCLKQNRISLDTSRRHMVPLLSGQLPTPAESVSRGFDSTLCAQFFIFYVPLGNLGHVVSVFSPGTDYSGFPQPWIMVLDAAHNIFKLKKKYFLSISINTKVVFVYVFVPVVLCVVFICDTWACTLE